MPTGDQKPYSSEKLAEAAVGEISSPASEISSDISKQTYTQSLKLWSVNNPTITLRKAFLRPFVLVAYPTILWASLVYGMALTWNVILALTIAQLFAGPPYAFNSGAQGLIFLAPLTGRYVNPLFSLHPRYTTNIHSVWSEPTSAALSPIRSLCPSLAGTVAFESLRCVSLLLLLRHSSHLLAWQLQLLATTTSLIGSVQSSASEC